LALSYSLIFISLNFYYVRVYDLGKKGGEMLRGYLPVALAIFVGLTFAKEKMEEGKELYEANCSMCHGENGLGVEGLGKDLLHSDFVKNLNDSALLEFITKGRTAEDSLNTTGIPMPPKGGNEELTNQEILKVIGYIRYLIERMERKVPKKDVNKE
jgi:mono/diheme cytochrome c family protein